MKRFAGGALALSVALFTSAVLTGPTKAEDEALSYARVYPDSDGVSHFGEDDIAWSRLPGLEASTTALLPARSVGFLRLPEGFSQGYHPSPRKQFLVVMKGLFEVTAGSGEKRVFAPGSVLLVEDTTGQGHRTRNAGQGEVLVTRVPVPPEE